MSITPIQTLKSWFVNKAKPNQGQFWAWMDSYFHKSEKIPAESVDGLQDIIRRIFVDNNRCDGAKRQ